MRDLPPAFAAHLAGGVTTLARCWRVTRRDGTELGFTDHDRDLDVDGVIHAAAAGLAPSETTIEAGFATGGGEVVGVLGDAGLNEDDIQRGLYDAATVTVTLVDWASPSTRLLLDRFEIGEIRRGDLGFVAELRGAATRHDEEQGRLYEARCDADLGDARCGLVLPPTTGTVAATDGHRNLTAMGLALAPGTLVGGRIRFTTGANAGQAVEIRSHVVEADLHGLGLWLPLPAPLAPGDAFEARQGCDKTLATCAGRFGNTPNFRGFPHMPGNDFVLRVVGDDGRAIMDGGSLFR